MTQDLISSPEPGTMPNEQRVVDPRLAQAGASPTPGAGADIDPVDLAVLASFDELQEDGAPDLIVELIDLYLEGAPVLISAIQNAVADADGLSLKGAAHSLKGSSGTLGVRLLAALCEELERLAADACSSEAKELVSKLEGEFVRARRVLVFEHLRRLSLK